MKGPQRQYDEIHILRTILILEKEKRIGRKQLVKKLDLGEGSVRSVLKFLIERNYLTSSVAKGHNLSKKGEEFLAKLHRFVLGPKIVDAKELTIGKKDVAVLVKNAAKKVKMGINERDAAIKKGSLGASVLIFRDKELRFPDQNKLNIKNKSLYKSFELEEEDVLIIGTDNTIVKAEIAAIAALFALVRNKIKIN